jgi:hypothetical protein
MSYDLNAIKKKLKEFGGSKSDPDEFRPAKAKPNETLKYRFYVLPGLLEGDKLKGGIVEKSMDLFFVNYGQHWVQNHPHACPRVYDGSECALCDFGLKLLRDKSLGDNERQKIRTDWLPNSSYVVNIFFPNVKANPEELRGRVMYYKAPKTLFDMWTACINRDAPDVIDPDEELEPYGVFFDESSAWLFELQVQMNGKTNGYKTSKFIVGNDKKPVPIAKNEDGSPNTKQIAQLLAQRINIWERLEAPDREKIKKLSNTLIYGDDAEESKPQMAKSSGFDSDEEDDLPKKASKPAAKHSVVDEDEDDAPAPPKKPAKVEEPKAKPKPAPIIEEDDDEDDSSLTSLLDQLDDDDA